MPVPQRNHSDVVEDNALSDVGRFPLGCALLLTASAVEKSLKPTEECQR